MPVWLKLLEYAVQALIWMYGHKAVMEKVEKVSPLKPDPLPPLSQENNPNMRNHYGGL